MKIRNGQANRPKWQNKKIWLIVAYLCVIVIWGPPYTNKKIVAGPNYATSAQESDLSKTFLTIRKPVLRTLMVIVIIGVFLVFYQDHSADRANSEIKIKRTIWLTNLCLGIYTVASIITFVFIALSFLVMESAQSKTLREFSRVDFVLYVALWLLSLSCMYNQIEWRRYFSKKGIAAILLDNCLKEYDKYIEKNAIEAASQAIAKTCEFFPSGIIPWAERAVFADKFLSSPVEAEEYFDKATENLKDNPNASNEEKAFYEFCWANILFRKGKTKQAEFHIKQSLRLPHNRYSDALRKILQEQEQTDLQSCEN